MKCPKCKKDCFQRIIVDHGFTLILRCSNCNHQYGISEPKNIMIDGERVKEFINKISKHISPNVTLLELREQHFPELYREGGL